MKFLSLKSNENFFITIANADKLQIKNAKLKMKNPIN